MNFAVFVCPPRTSLEFAVVSFRHVLFRGSLVFALSFFSDSLSMASLLTFKEAQELAMAKIQELADAKERDKKEVVDFVTTWLLTKGIKECIERTPYYVRTTMSEIGRDGNVHIRFFSGGPYVHVKISPPSGLFCESVTAAVAEKLRAAGFKVEEHGMTGTTLHILLGP